MLLSQTSPSITTPWGSLDDSSSSFSMAFRDSGGFFDDITDKQWLRMKKRVAERQNYLGDPNHNIDQPNKWYGENFEPDFTCLHERRLGDPPVGDGPKWICDPHRLEQKQDCLVYSVGSNGDFSFERSIQKHIGRHCEIHTFDPEMTGKHANTSFTIPEGVHYHAWGLEGNEGSRAQQRYVRHWAHKHHLGTFKSFKTTIEEMGHQGRTIDIFKIDCEGCEFTTYWDWFNTSGTTLRQILVEVHKTPPDRVHDFFLGMQQAGYVTFHKEPNIMFGGGVCVEYAFLKLEDSFYETMRKE